MNIRFIPFDKTKEKTSLRAFVYHRGHEYRISIGESVITKYWNENKNRCKLVREYAESAIINKNLNDIENIITEIVKSYGLVTPSESQVRTDFKNYREKIDIEAGAKANNDKKHYLVDFATTFMNESDRKHNTKKTYQTTIRKLIEYEKTYKKRLAFSDIDMEFYNSFKRWLTEEGYSKNFIGTIFKNVKMFMNKSEELNLHSFDGYKHKDFKSEKEDTDAIYLTTEEIDEIYKLEFTKELLLKNGFTEKANNIKRAIKSLNEERDRFLIGCYTALRHSDYSRIDILNFKDDLISIWTVKKDKKVFIPIHYRLREILKRRNNILPGKISEQKHNEHLKMIGRLAGINSEVLLTKTRGGKRESITGKKYKFITSHTCRRSGATNMYLSGIDIKFIQDILGHSKLEQTIKYIKVAAEENAKRLQSHPYFTGK